MISRVLTNYATSVSLKRQRTFTKDDLVKTRFLIRVLYLVGFIAALSLIYIWSRVQIVRYGYEINDLKIEQRLLAEENRQIQLELSTLKSPQRIERIAKDKLHMTTPGVDQIKWIPLN